MPGETDWGKLEEPTIGMATVLRICIIQIALPKNDGKFFKILQVYFVKRNLLPFNLLPLL